MQSLSEKCTELSHWRKTLTAAREQLDDMLEAVKVTPEYQEALSSLEHFNSEINTLVKDIHDLTLAGDEDPHVYIQMRKIIIYDDDDLIAWAIDKNMSGFLSINATAVHEIATTFAIGKDLPTTLLSTGLNMPVSVIAEAKPSIRWKALDKLALTVDEDITDVYGV